jgi:peptide/nickel transport system substrate-binding protein
MKKVSAKSRFMHLSLAVCLLISVILTGCTASNHQSSDNASVSNDPKQATSGPVYGGTLKLILIDYTANLGFPAEQRGTGFLYYSSPALESLGRFDKDGKLVPLLAESWQANPKAKTITFKLKQGIKFHDGTDFNAEAVKWNIEQYQAAKRPEVQGIQSMDVVDAATLRLNLAEWDSTLLNSVAYYVRIISPAAVAKNGKEWAAKNPVGTGPFQFVSSERETSTKFKKNEQYWQKGKPYLDAIEYSYIQDRNTAANVFRTGGSDVLTLMDPEVYQELEKSGKYATHTNDDVFGALGIGIMFDSANPNSPFANVKVRQAAMYAVDKKAIIDSVLFGFGTVTNQWNTSSTWSYNPDVKGFPYDPEKAKQLLAEAGYPNGFKTKLTTEPGKVKIMTAIQSYLAKVGIDAQLVTVDLGKLTALAGDKWDGMLYFPMLLGPAATVQLRNMFGQNGTLYAKNIIHPDKVEQLLAEARTAPDFESEKKAVHALQQAIFEENAIAFPVLRLKAGIAMDTKVRNLGMWTVNGLDWNPEDVWKQK